MKYLYRTKLFAGISLVIVFSFFVLSCKKNRGNASRYPREVNIEYRVTKVSGSSSELAYGSYTNATGGNNFFDNAPIPFTVKFRRSVEQGEAIAFAFTENNNGQNTSSTLRAEILVDNQVKESKLFSGSSPVIGSIAYVFQ